MIEVDNFKNEAILRDILQKWKVECRADGLVPMRFVIFPHVSEVLRLPRKSEARSYEVLHMSHKIIFPKLKSEAGVFCTFLLRTVLRATTPCTFWTSHLPKVLPCWCGLYVFISTHASRHNGVHFFQHLNFQNCSEPEVFCAFWFRNVLRATEACNFSSLISPDGLRTRRFSEPTFRPSGATNHRKNTVFRDFATFSRTCIFCLLTLALLWSSFFFSSLVWLFPSAFSSVDIVGSLASKLPSNRYIIDLH